MIRFHSDLDTAPRLTGLVRLDVFASVEQPARGKRKARTVGVGWQGWNSDARMEQVCARLVGSGSFYWQGAISAFAAARRAMADDPRVHQIKLETINGVEIGRLYR